MQPDKKKRKPLKKVSQNLSLQIRLDVTAEVDAKGNYCQRSLKETVYEYLSHLISDDSLHYQVVGVTPDTEVAPWQN